MDGVKEKLEKELESAPKNFIVQVESPSEEYNTVIDTSIEFLLKDKDAKKIIYVTLNKPVSMLLHGFEAKKIDSNRFFFIDGISGSSQRRESDDKKFVVLSGPTALTELSIEITKAKETGQFDYIFFDTISTLLIYNSPKRCLQFSYFLLTKLRDFELSGLIIYLKSDLEKEVFEGVAHLSDKVLRF